MEQIGALRRSLLHRRRPAIVAALASVALGLVLITRLDAAGSLAAVTPSGASPGIAIQLTGTGFNGTAANNAVTFRDAAGTTATVTPSAVTVVDSAKGIRRLSLKVPAGLAIGPAAMTVLNKKTNETIGGLSIEIVSLTLPDVAAGQIGATNVLVRILGSPNSRFAQGSRADFGPRITVLSTVVESATSAVARINIGALATAGPRPVSMISPTQTASLTNGFTVTTDAPPPPANAAPTVSAGANQKVNLPASVTLNGTATDDGLPSGSALALTWSKQSGPGTVTFSSRNSAVSDASFSVPGTYVLRLTATDGDKSAFSEVTVAAVLVNAAPIVSAGADQTTTQPAAASLSASISDDGNPAGSSLTITWSKRSGAGTATFSAKTSAITNVTFSQAGTYVLRVTASDGEKSAYDEVSIVAKAAAANTAPTVNAGADLSVALADDAALQGNATDDGLPAGSTLAPTWTKVSGPGTVSFGNASALATSARFSKTGSYTLKLTVTDGVKSASDNIVITVTAAAANAAPVVSAGTDQTITLPATAAIAGSVKDDGRPAGSTVVTTWSQREGPGTASFSPANAASTTVTFSAPGTYLLRLTASDGDQSAFDEVSIKVDPAVVNAAPVVNAGSDQEITLPTPAALVGTVTDDNLPAGVQLTFAWTKVSGPGVVTFAAPAAASTTATFSEAGAYVLRLTANDSDKSAFDELAITVKPPTAQNTAPVVNAGGDLSITLPAPAALQGTVTDDGKPTTTVTIAWRKVEGPGDVTFVPPGAAATTATFSAAGKYTLELRGDDGALSAADTLVVNVGSPTATNTAPSVNAGADQEVGIDIGASLTASVSDDGKPGAALQITWKQVSGPGQASFTTAGNPSTGTTFTAPGVYVLAITVSDGELTASDDLAITVRAASVQGDRAPPIVTLEAPTEALPGALVDVRAQAADDVAVAGVRFEAAGTTPPEKVAPPYQVQFNVPELAEPGSTIEVKAIARDSSNNTAEAKASIRVSVTPDTQSPAVQISGPSIAAAGRSLQMYAIASDNVGIASVAFLVNGAEVVSDREKPYMTAYLVPADAAVGSTLQLLVRARDLAGNIAESTAQVQVVSLDNGDTTPPVVELTAPAQAAAGAAIDLAATATDTNGIAALTFRVGALQLGVDNEAPYTARYVIPPFSEPGSAIDVTAEATDFAGLKATSTRSVTVVATSRLTQAIVTGEVYDDVTSLPLMGASVALIGSDEAGVPYDATAVTDARGRYILRTTPGAGVIRIAKLGWTGADRPITLVAGQAIEALDARLTMFRAGPQSLSSVLGGVLGGETRLLLPPGALAQDQSFQIAGLSQQGLQARLPLGWSPVGAADIAPHGVQLSSAAMVRVPNAFTLDGSATVLAAQWDEEAARWRAIGPARVAGNTIEADITASGQIAFLVADALPLAPAMPAPGAVLAGVNAAALPLSLTTEINPQPQVLFYRPGTFSEVRGRITAAQPVTSGARMIARLSESYTFYSGAQARPEPFVEDLLFYQVSAPASGLIAAANVTPSLAFDPLTLERGVITVELFAEGTLAPVSVVDASGGPIEGPAGLRLIVPPGAVGNASPIVIGSLDASDLGTLPAGLTLIQGVSVAAPEALARSASLSLPKPAAMVSAADLLLVRLDDIGGRTRFVLAGVMRIDGDRLVSDTVVANQQTALSGVREGGRYAIVKTDAAPGFAGGLVKGITGQPFAGALVEAAAFSIVSLSNAAGGYLAAAPVGQVQLTATDLAKSDTGTASSVFSAGALLPIALQLVAQPPRVTAIAPTNGEANVPLAGTLRVTFSEAIDPASVAGANLANVTLADAQGTRIDGAASLSQQNTVLIFRPSSPLAANSRYTVTLGTGIKDTSGYGLPGVVTSSFDSLDTNPPAPPPAGELSASIPNAQGLTTVSGTQGTAGPADRVFIDNLTKKTVAVALVDPNGSFSTSIAAALTDKLRVRIVDASGNETIQELGVFKQTNSDGSISQAVGSEGGVVDGPGGVRATIKPGTFPNGAAVTLNTVANNDIPIDFTAEQAEVFEKQGGFTIDFGGASPEQYIDVSVPAGPNDTEADQWVVAEVVTLNGETFYNVTDTAKFRDGRITTASPPCPGVTAAGVYGLTKAKQTYGLNYAEMYGNGRYTLKASLEYWAANPLVSPFNVLSAQLPTPVCFPVISGRVNIVPNTTRVHVNGAVLTPTDREVVITNTTRGSGPVTYPRTVADFVFDNPWPNDGPLSGSQYRGVMQAGGVTQAVPVIVDTLNGEQKLVVRAGSVSIPAATIEIVDITRVRTVTLPLALQPFEVSVSGGATDTFEVVAVPRPALYLSTAGAPAEYLLRRVVNHVKFPSPYGEGNLVLKVQKGTIDPTRAEMDAAGVGGPARTHTYLASAKIGIKLIDNAKIVQGGIEGIAFEGDPEDDFNFVVVYDSRPNFLTRVPRTRLVVTNTLTGDTVSARFIQAPPRDEPVEVAPIIDDSVDPVVVSGPSRVDNFDPTSLLTFRFSESMDAQSVKDNFVVLDKDGKRVAGDVRISELNRTATFVPAGGLQLGEQYTVVLRGRVGDEDDKGGNGFIRDISGRSIQQVKLNVRTYRPRPIASFPSPDAFKDIGIRRKRQGPNDPLRTSLFITTGGQTNNLSVLDVTDPFHPARVGGDTSLPSRQRIAVIPEARFTFGGGARPQRFSGDFAITTAFNVSRSFVTFLNIDDPAHPATIGTKVLTRVPEDFSQGFPVVWENAYAKGITAVQAADEVYAYAAVERVGLMFIDVGNNLPQQKLETIYPGDITDVVAYRDVLFALDKTRGQAQLLTLGLSFEERAPTTLLSSTPRRIRIGEQLMSDLNGDGRVLTDEQVDVAVVGTDKDLQIYSIADRTGRVGDALDPKPLELVSRVPMKGTVRDVEIDPSRLRAIAIVDEGNGPVLVVVDLARLDGAQSTLGLIDADANGDDDRIVFRHAFPTGVNGMRMDFERGLLYVGHPSGLEIWQVFDNCCDLGVDMTRSVKIRPSGRSAEVFAGELNAIKRGVIAGLLRAEAKCSGFDVSKMKLIESGSSACLWRDDPEKACGNNYQPGLSDHDISTFMPDEWYDVNVSDPDFPEDFVGPPTQIPLAACVVSALTYPFTDPYTEEPKDVENTGYFFHDISFLPNWIKDFNSSDYRLDRTIEGIAGDADNDLGMGRQLQAMKHLTEAHGMDLREVKGATPPKRFEAVHVEDTKFEELFKQFRTITRVPAAEGYEWSMLMEFMFAKGKTYLRIAGSADEGSAFHKYNVKQLHMAGKAAIRAAVARIVSMPSSRAMFLGVRRTKKPATEPDDPNDRGYSGQEILEFDRNACFVFRGDKDPASAAPPPFAQGIFDVDWDATRCGSMEEYAASTAIRTLTLPVNEQPFTLDEVKDIVKFYRIKADLESITTDAEGDALIGSAIRFVQRVKAATFPIYAQEVESPNSTDPKRAKRMANRDYAEGAAEPNGQRSGGRIKEFLVNSKLELVPHVYNRSFRNAPGVKLRMHLAKPGQQAASPYCGTAKEPLEDCAFQLDIAGGEHVYPAWRRKADDTLLLNDESSQAIPIFKLTYNVLDDQKKGGYVAFTVDLAEHTVKEAYRDNNLGGFRYSILGLDGNVNIGPVQPDVPSPYGADAFTPDPECIASPALILTQHMTLADDVAQVKAELASPVLLYQGQNATLHVEVNNPTPNAVTDTTVCTTLAAAGATGGAQQACRSGITVGAGQTVPVVFPFMSKKPVVIESVATASSPDVGMTTSQPFSVSVNCEPLLVYYDPDPNTLGPQFSVMRGGRGVRYLRAINPFTGLPAYDTQVELKVVGDDALQVFQALRGLGGGGIDKYAGLGKRDAAGNLSGDYSKDYEGMAFRVPDTTSFGQHRVEVVKVNGSEISCGAPVDLSFMVRPFEYSQSMALGAAAKFGLALELAATGSVNGGLKFTFGVKRENDIKESDGLVDRLLKDLDNIKSLDFEPTAGIGLELKASSGLFEASGGVKDLVEAKATLGKIEAGGDFSATSGNRFRFGGFQVFKNEGPTGAEAKLLGSLVAFTMLQKGAYEIAKLAEWIPPLRRPFEQVLKQVERFEPRRTHTLGTYGVKFTGAGTLFKGEADVLPPEKDTSDDDPGGGNGGGNGGNGGSDPEPKKEPGLSVLNMEMTVAGNASASAALEQTQRLRQAPGEAGPLDKETWINLDFAFDWKSAFDAKLPLWRDSLAKAEFDEDKDIDEAVKKRGGEELGKIENWIKEGLAKVCEPNCNGALAGNISFGVKSELETEGGVPKWIVKKVMIRFRSPKQVKPFSDNKNETKGEYRITYALDAARYAPGSDEFKKLLARLLIKLKALAFALTEEQRIRADQLIADLGLTGHPDFKSLVAIATRPPEPIDGEKVFSDFMGALRIIIANGDVTEEMTKRQEHGLTVGGKIKIFGVGGEIEFTPIQFVREVEYQKAVGRLVQGKLFMLEDYTDAVLTPFDPQEYLKQTIQTYVSDVFNEVLRKLKEDFIEGVENTKKFIGTQATKLKNVVDDGVKALPWPFLRDQPAPDAAVVPYAPLDDRARAGRVHYGIGGFLFFDSETGSLSQPGLLEFTYRDEELEGAPESDVRLYRWSTVRRDWEVQQANVNLATNTVSKDITELGLYTLGVLMPAGDFTWTVVSSIVSGQGANLVTTVQLESSPLQRNDGNPAAPGALVHLRVVGLDDLRDFEATSIGTVTTADADAILPGAQVASDADGRVRATVTIPGRQTRLYLQAFTDVGTADGTAAIALPQP